MNDYREAEAVKAIKIKSSTPMVSPITTPSKAHTVTSREDGDGDSTHEDMCVKPLNNMDQSKNSDVTTEDTEQTTSNHQNETGAFTVNGEVGHSEGESTATQDVVTGENLDSMQVEQGSQQAITSQNVTDTFQTAAEDESNDSLHNSHNWQSKRR